MSLRTARSVVQTRCSTRQNLGVAPQPLWASPFVTHTRSANRALHISVTHGPHNLRRLPKDELDRQREGSMRVLLFSLSSFGKADEGAFLRGVQMRVAERQV